MSIIAHRAWITYSVNVCALFIQSSNKQFNT